MKTNESGFNSKIVSKGALDILGSKTDDAGVTGKNKITHPYTIQMTINAAWKFISLSLNIFQESKSQFGSIIMQKLAKAEYQTTNWKIL